MKIWFVFWIQTSNFPAYTKLYSANWGQGYWNAYGLNSTIYKQSLNIKVKEKVANSLGCNRVTSLISLWKSHWLAHWLGSSWNMFFAASSDNQVWKFFFGSGLTLLRSAAGWLMFSLDDKLKAEVFLDSPSSALVGTEHKKKIENKNINNRTKRIEKARRDGERKDQNEWMNAWTNERTNEQTNE